MFGRRRREEEAAEEAAREAERRALFAKLAERPEEICPFLGLEGDRTGYVDGVSDEHRCFAFGEPAPLSAEQQTRVCQERGYGNCPRYLRGVLVIPTEELEALRRPRPLGEIPPPPPLEQPPDRRRRALPIIVAAVLLLGVVGAGAYLFLTGAIGTASGDPSPSPTRTAAPTAAASPSDEPSADPSGLGSPSPEPTPSAGDRFVFYEVAVAPDTFRIFLVGDDGVIEDTRTISFDGFSFAMARPVEAEDGDALWQIEDGALAGYAYRYPESGEFRVRAVFRSGEGDRRSFYLQRDELQDVPEETPAPVR